MKPNIHVTRIDRDGGVYGHETTHCDTSGCAGDEWYLGVHELAKVGHVYSADFEYEIEDDE